MKIAAGTQVDSGFRQGPQGDVYVEAGGEAWPREAYIKQCVAVKRERISTTLPEIEAQSPRPAMEAPLRRQKRALIARMACTGPRSNELALEDVLIAARVLARQGTASRTTSATYVEACLNASAGSIMLRSLRLDAFISDSPRGAIPEAAEEPDEVNGQVPLLLILELRLFVEDQGRHLQLIEKLSILS